jgi:hypothetical protein
MGPRERIPRALRTIGPDELRAFFPKLAVGEYKSVSQANPRYNCLAFVCGDERHWWEAGRHGGRYYWPPDATPSTTIAVISEIFTSDGYEPTDNKTIEPEYEKVAIYASLDDMEFSHIAKCDGRVWKSKLGKGQDIEHYSLAVLEGDQGDEYGIVERILRRRLDDQNTDTSTVEK